MNSSVVSTTCNALSVVDLIAIIGVFVYLNRRINHLEENGHGISAASSSVPRSRQITQTPLEDRVNILENEREILLQRLQVYDELLMKIMQRMKEMGPILDRIVEEPAPIIIEATPCTSNTSPRRAAIRRRTKEAVIARRERFVDEGETNTPDDTMDANINRTYGRGCLPVRRSSSPGTSSVPQSVDGDDTLPPACESEDETFSFLKT